jgi:signal transduction histidine kinase
VDGTVGSGVAGPGAPLPGSEWLVGGGEMGATVRARDWSGTPLGPIGDWPTSLRTTISLALNSSLPTSVAWGPRHIQIYNDGYRPFCGEKHPVAMGMDFSECWASAFPVIGEPFRQALAGTTAFLSDQRMFLDRFGFLEETCFTFAFSPIRDENGDVAGLYHPVTEVTAGMLADRRTRLLRRLADGAVTAGSMAEGLHSAAGTLADAALDLPFVLFYASDGQVARLVGSQGLVPGTSSCPSVVPLTATGSGWPIAEVFASGSAVLVEDVDRVFPGLACEPYPEPVQQALVMPITPAGYGGPPCLMVAAASPRLPLTDTYRAFFEMVAAAVTTVVVNATAISVAQDRAEALAEIDRAKTAFFTNVSHEFRTPLTLMLGPLQEELADVGDDTAPVRRERLETAHRNSLRLLRLVNTLLDVARIEEGRTVARFEPTDLAGLTADLAGTFRSACERAGLELDVSCPPLPHPVHVDHGMWEAVVLNLLSNALKFTAAGRIGVRVRPLEDGVEVAVSDTGAGIPALDLPRIFERFYRVAGVEGRSHEGSGIGLAFVQQLVAQHGGTVAAISEVGVGTTISVRLPLGSAHLPPEQVRSGNGTADGAGRADLDSTRSLVQEAMGWLVAPVPVPAPRESPSVESTEPSPSAVPASDAEGPAPRRSRIVWADDNADMRRYVTRLLADDYDVETVVDGVAALDAVRRDPPDLVLTDVMMPRLDGFGLLRRLRADPLTRAIPIILLSARAGEETVLEGLAQGADDYLVKPFTARELEARIGAHLQLTRLRREAEEARVETARSAAALAEQRLAEERIARLNDGLELRIRDRTLELTRANAELASANRELESFSYSVSHDLRAPLRAIDGFSRILQDQYADDLPPDARRYFDLVRGSARRMGRLVDELLAFTKLGRQVIRRSEVDVRVLVDSCLDDLAPERAGRDIRVEIGELPACHADPTLLRQVWMNLLGNAVKYTGTRDVARIVVGATDDADGITYFCQDNGAGFDMRYATNIFGVFQRMHAQEEYEGTGVGLAIVDQVVRRHGGRVWAEAEVDQGATFRFTLTSEPAAADQPDEVLARA